MSSSLRTNPISSPKASRGSFPARLLQEADPRNLIIIAAAFLLFLLLVPFPHEFTTTDDWIYIPSVRHMMDTGTFQPPGLTQANLLGLTLWGVLWSYLFGYNITVLTASTLFMALTSLLLFYGIMRELGISPGASLFGTGLLGFNPIFVHLSYSFMTDVPFLALFFGSIYCYLRSAREDGWRKAIGWGLLGSVLAGWAFLMRQYGILVPIVFTIYFILEGLLERKWRSRVWWARLGAVTAIPAAIALWFSLAFPLTRAMELATRRAELFTFKEAWLRVFLLRAFSLLPVTALFAWGALKLRGKQLWLVAGVGLSLLFGMHLVDLPSERWIQQLAPPFTARIGPFTYDFPDEPYSFGAYGNIVRVTGIDFDEFFYNQQPVWDGKVWRYLFMLGVALSALLLVKIGLSGYDWLRRTLGERKLTPLSAFYALGMVIFVVSMAFPGYLFDRYILAFLPFFILFVARGSSSWGRLAWAYSIAGLAVLGTFTLLAKADHMEHNRVRWEAAAWMEARTGAVKAGWNWNHWGHRDSETYIVDDLPVEGFRVEQKFPYSCRLCGFTTRYVLAQAKSDAPPLPAAP